MTDDGKLYEGYWKNGVQHGVGRFGFENEMRYGIWSNGNCERWLDERNPADRKTIQTFFSLEEEHIPAPAFAPEPEPEPEYELNEEERKDALIVQNLMATNQNHRIDNLILTPKKNNEEEEEMHYEDEREAHFELPKREVNYEPPKREINYESPKREVNYEPPKREINYELPKREIIYEPPKREIIYEPPKREIIYEPPKREIIYEPPKEIRSEPKKEIPKEEKQSIQAPPSKDKEGDEAMLCKICYSEKNNTALIPCGHLLCKKCANNISTCPFDNKLVSQRVGIFY